MQPGAVPGPGLDGVAEGVAEIEQRALARLALVGGDDARLQLAAAPHGVGEGRAIARQQLLDVGFEPVDERSVEREAVLDHLGQARAQLAVGQRVEGRHVRDHRARLVEGADHVLAERVVDRGLAADRGVDLREQRGRHLDERHAALVDGGGEPRQVADHAAAQRDDQRVAPAARLEQRDRTPG